MIDLDTPDPQTPTLPPRFDQFIANKSSDTQGVKPSNTWGAARSGHRHQGQDFGGPIDSPVGSADDGEIVFVGPNGNMGNAVKVKHPDGTISVYGHLNKINVQQGDSVKAGASIGLLGQTGNAKGPHVHFELYQNGLPIDPAGTKYRPQIGTSPPRFDEFTQQAAPVSTVTPPRFDEFIKPQQPPLKTPATSVTLGEGAIDESQPVKPLNIQVADDALAALKEGRPRRMADAPAPILFQQGNAIPRNAGPTELMMRPFDEAPKGTVEDQLTQQQYKSPQSTELGTAVKIPFSPHLNPTEDDLVKGYLTAMGPEYARLGAQYKAQTGHNILSLQPGDVDRDPDGSAYVKPTRAGVDILNAYVKSGGDIKAAQAEGARIAGERRGAVATAQQQAAPGIAEVQAGRTGLATLPAAQRAIESPVISYGAGKISQIGGLVSAFGLAPSRVSNYLNTRGKIMELGSSLPPLTPQGQEIQRGVPEKVATSLTHLGLGVLDIIAMKRASGLSTGQVMALESALQDSNDSLPQRAARTAQAFAMGKVLDSHLDRITSAGIFGVPTGVESAQAVARGEKSKTDALLDTAIQGGLGAILGGGKAEVDARTPEVQSREFLGIGRAPIVPDITAQLAAREAAVKPVTDTQGNVLLNADEVAAGGKPRVRLTGRGIDETDTTRRVPADIVTQAPAPESGAIPTPSANATISSPAEGLRVRGAVRSSEPMETGQAASNEGTEASIQSNVAPSVRHVDLQSRRTRNTETGTKGQFKPETPAQAETRRALVSQSVSTPQPDLSTQAQPGTVRLYRGQGIQEPGAGSANKADAGRWFTNNRAMAEDYAEQTRLSDKAEPLTYVDVPESEAARMFRRNGNPDKSLSDPINRNAEFVLDNKYLRQAQPATPDTANVTPQGVARATSTPERTPIKPEEVQIGDSIRSRSDETVAGTAGEIISIGPKNVKIKSTIRFAPDGPWIEQVHKIARTDIAEAYRPAPPVPEGKMVAPSPPETLAQRPLRGDELPETESNRQAGSQKPEASVRATSTIIPREAVPEGKASEPVVKPDLSKPPETTGIARRVEESRRVQLGQEPTPSGEGISAEDSVNRGRQLLKDGRDPQSAVDSFKKSGAISGDAMAVVRAKHEELAQAANKAFDAGGQNLKDPKFQAAEKARQDWWERSVKPMQTEWHKTGMAQQGETAIDTGTFYGIYRAVKQQAGREMIPREESAAKNLSSRVTSAESNAQDANRSLIDALNKATGVKDLDPDIQKAISRFIEESRRETRTQKRQQARKTLDEEATIIKSNIAAEFARLKSQSTKGQFTSMTGLGSLDPDGVITKELIKYAKNRVKAGITDTAQLIDDTHGFIKDFADVSRQQVAEALTGVSTREKQEPSDWMKAKGDIKQGLKVDAAARELKSLGERVVAGKRVSPEDVKAVWRHATDNYINKGMEYGEAVQKTAADLGATPEQVRRALASKAAVRPLEDAAYRRMAARRQAKAEAERWVRNIDRSPALKVAQTASDAFFNLATFGHGTVGPVTHAAENIFHPTRWVDYFRNVGRTWKAAYSSATHERYMQDLVNDPNYTTARRAGLANEPGKFYDEYQNNLAQKMFGSIGKIGNRGFDVLKRMRQDFFNARWSKLDETQKTPETAQAIADLVNHSTGAIRTKLPYAGLTRGVFFAAPLELSRWARILGDPIRAADTFTNWKAATPSEKYFAKSVVKNHAGFLATYLGALALNQAVLTASKSDDKINFTDPSKSDWLRFKVKGRTLDLSGGIVGTLGLLGRLGQAAIGKQNPREGRFERIGKASADYARGKLSPIASVGTDVITQSDFRGRPMPFSSDKEREGRPRYSWPEYGLSRTSPIPLSEGARDFFDEMHKQGVPVDTTKAIFNAALNHPTAIAKGAGIGVVSGSTGVRIGAEFQQTNPSGKLLKSRNGNDPLAKELMRIDHQVNGVSKAPDESQPDFEKRRAAVNPQIEADLRGLVDTRAYKTLSDADKKEQITMHLRKVTKEANENYYIQNGGAKVKTPGQVYIIP